MYTERNRVRLAALRLAACAAALIGASAVVPAVAGAAPTARWQQTSYLSEQLSVPSGWPIYRLAERPTLCVQFDRHALYEGAGTAKSNCPAQVIGVAAAAQVEPLADLSELETADDLVATSIGGQPALISENSAVTRRLVVAFPQTGVLATISYRTGAGYAQAHAILNSFTAKTPTASSSTVNASSETPGAVAMAATPKSGVIQPMRETAKSTAVADISSVPYAGKGFDTCYAPSTSQMAAWRRASPYQAVGVYIGGANAACSNVTASWVTTETALGWRVFPLYVGLQAPCADQRGLASIAKNTKTAAAQGAQAARNAASNAASLDMGSGATIYYDMEAWRNSSASCNAAVIAFVRSWTTELHAEGYHSGVYGSLLEGIHQIQSLWGSTGAPDVLYFAAWDGVATTANPDIPSAEWPGNDRIKQYESSAQSYGGVSLNIDEDDLDAPTVGYPGPTLSSISPPTGPTGITVILKGSGLGVGTPTVRFGGVVGGNVTVISPTELEVSVPPQSPGNVDVTVTTGAGKSRASSAYRFQYSPIVAMATDPTTDGYWVTSARGDVESFAANWYGSTAQTRLPAPVVGMAATSTGYLLATARGGVYAFNTPDYGSMGDETLPSPVVGIAATATGYLLATAGGNVYAFNTAYYGSLPTTTLSSPVVGIAATPTGYLLTTSTGTVYAFNTPSYGSAPSGVKHVVGITGTATGYFLSTSGGGIFTFNTPYDGSMGNQPMGTPAVGAAATSTGYLLANSGGNIYNFDTAFDESPASRGRPAPPPSPAPPAQP